MNKIFLKSFESVTFNSPLTSFGILWFSVSKLILAGIIPVSNAYRTLAIDTRPDTGSVWPTFDLTEPISRGLLRSTQKTSEMAFNSCLSPTY